LIGNVIVGIAIAVLASSSIETALHMPFFLLLPIRICSGCFMVLKTKGVCIASTHTPLYTRVCLSTTILAAALQSPRSLSITVLMR
jgi:hypothetical protein